MIKQKRAALINDLTGFGRCSLSVEQPIVSAMGIEACVMPTALLSVHTAFPNPYMVDLTSILQPYMDNWAEHGITFDGISTGFLGSKEQVSLVEEFIHRFKGKETLVIVDPVMGDWGRLYASYSEELAREMKRLLPLADVITPNLTEAVTLAGRDYPPEGNISDEALESLAAQLSAMGPAQVVITGISRGNTVGNFIYERGKGRELVSLPRTGGERSGTGDVFTGVLTGALIRGESLKESVTRAARFVEKTMAYTEKQHIPPACGLIFEPFLSDLNDVKYRT
jgi:pyridoxine kinase